MTWADGRTGGPGECDQEGSARLLGLYDDSRRRTQFGPASSGVAAQLLRLAVRARTPRGNPSARLLAPRPTHRLPTIVVREQLDDSWTMTGARTSGPCSTGRSARCFTGRVCASRSSAGSISTSVDFSSGLVRVLGKGRKERLVPLHRKALEAVRLWIDDARDDVSQERLAHPRPSSSIAAGGAWARATCGASSITACRARPRASPRAAPHLRHAPGRGRRGPARRPRTPRTREPQRRPRSTPTSRSRACRTCTTTPTRGARPRTPVH